MNPWAFLACALVASALLVGSGSLAADQTKFPGGSLVVADITAALRERTPRSLKPVGTTSVVFKLDLDGGIDAAWKPHTTRHPQGHRAEVAAFRIGRALGMDNVAPAVPRSLRAETVKSLLPGDSVARWEALLAEMPPVGELIEGTAIYWIPDMHELGLESKSGMQRWTRWLAQDGDPPSRDKSRTMAADVSTMLLFDYLVGNWDRWSGANAQGDHDGARLFVRDHNVAFFEPLPRVQHERMLARVKRVERLSRSFISALKALDERRLREALASPDDPAGYVALEPRQIASVLDRRRALLSYIASVLDHYGANKVLSFP